jgi:hypothetical protein
MYILDPGFSMRSAHEKISKKEKKSTLHHVHCTTSNALPSSRPAHLLFSSPVRDFAVSIISVQWLQMRQTDMCRSPVQAVAVR